MPPTWTRRPNEPPRAHAAFIAYRDLPTDKRSLKAAAETSGKGAVNLRLLEKWSVLHDWVKRAAAWDAHLDGKKQRAHETAAQAIGRRQARLGKAMQAKAEKRLGSIPEAELTGSDVARLAKVGSDLERIGAGLPTGRLAVEGPNGGPVVVADPIAAAVARDPELRKAAQRLLEAAGQPEEPKP